jgi:hypothetical protein
VHRIALFYVRPWIFSVHIDAGFWRAPGYCACTGTPSKGPSLDIERAQGGIFWVRLQILRVDKDALFGCDPAYCACARTPFLGCVPEYYACTGTPFLGASLNVSLAKGTTIFLWVSVYCEFTWMQYLGRSLDISRAQGRRFHCVPGHSSCTGTPIPLRSRR